MAYKTGDRVKETTTSTGVGNITLSGAVAQFVAFNTVCANNDTCTVSIVGQGGTEWEVSRCTWLTGGILQRNTVLKSSNANALVNFSAGTKDVFITLSGSEATGSGKLVLNTGPTFEASATVTGLGGNGTQSKLTVFNPDDGAGHAGGELSLVSEGWGEWALYYGSTLSASNKIFWASEQKSKLKSFANGVSFMANDGVTETFNVNNQGVGKIKGLALGLQSIATAGSTTTLTASSHYNTVFTGTLSQNCKLPDATTLISGQSYNIVNKSSGVITIQINDLSTLFTILAGNSANLVCTDISTSNGTWSITSEQTSIVGITGTKAQFDAAVTDGNILFVGDVTQYTDEQAQDAIGTILTDSTTIGFTYNDAGNTITADVKANSIPINDLSDVVITTPSTGQVIKYNGTNWINDTDATGGGGFTPGCVIVRSDASTTQSFPATSFNKVSAALATEVLDENSWWDHATKKFQPTAAGVYSISAGIQLNHTINAAASVIPTIYKNGVSYVHLGRAWVPIAGVFGASGTCIIELNGSSDYVEFFAYNSYSSAISTQAGIERVFFNAYRIK